VNLNKSLKIVADGLEKEINELKNSLTGKYIAKEVVEQAGKLIQMDSENIKSFIEANREELNRRFELID
jgi:hypothetical protein